MERGVLSWRRVVTLIQRRRSHSSELPEGGGGILSA